MRALLLVLILALASCSDRTAAPVIPAALDIGTNRDVFIGTTRGVNDAGEYGIGRSTSLNLLQATVSLPPGRALGTVSDGQERPKLDRDFVIAGLDRYPSDQSFRAALEADIRSQPAGQREVTLFVHGFNNSFSDSAFRLAQLVDDLEIPGTHVAYSWPSRGNPLGYEYDRDSALFARDGLADLLRLIRSAGQPDIVLVAHSMGSALVMETLRQLEIAEPGWTGRNINAVILLSPDINVDVFRSQFSRIQTAPDPFVVMVSRKDAILRVSSRLRGERSQLGNIENADSVADLPITVVDVTAFTDRKSGNHFVAGGSPALIQLLRRSSDLDREFLRGRPGTVLTIPGARRIRAPVRVTDNTIIPGESR
ncbi:alpha/beta fold hydrolase [Tateyamaria omphalii]|uniref:alpha/beta hydrolase n=1 Tax=Tateyamaria omphalii TaxID=299262 RepID=UPI001C99F298|nr:alpha/beta fold hydrolase [Tateyamaria omphalii]MBY5933413.1 alpha/beta fold hydrolase [Tateyamaria omphalii]